MNPGWILALVPLALALLFVLDVALTGHRQGRRALISDPTASTSSGHFIPVAPTQGTPTTTSHRPSTIPTQRSPR